MSSFFSAIANLFRRLFSSTRRSDEGSTQQREPRVQASEQENVPRQQDHPRQNLSRERDAVPAELRQRVYQAVYNMPKQRMHAGQFGSRLRQAEDGRAHV